MLLDICARVVVGGRNKLQVRMALFSVALRFAMAVVLAACIMFLLNKQS